jgi:Icc-related predicted phosphoesterase
VHSATAEVGSRGTAPVPSLRGLVRVVVISDTHGLHEGLTMPRGDVLIVCGDFTMMGSLSEISKFGAWLRRQTSFRHRIVVAGNHDLMFERERYMAISTLVAGGAATYLEDEETVADGLRIYGSPWTPLFMDWAFMRRSEDLVETWGRIPEGLDVLVTHGPPRGIMDRLAENGSEPHADVGCTALRDRLFAMERPPRVHVFGHIHEGHGVKVVGPTKFVNASVLDEYYHLAHPPVVFDI